MPGMVPPCRDGLSLGSAYWVGLFSRSENHEVLKQLMKQQRTSAHPRKKRST